MTHPFAHASMRPAPACGAAPEPSAGPRPTDVLRDEHRVVERALGVLEKMADVAATERRIDAQDAADAVDFLRTFLDACHHGKEEGALFPAMERHGFPAHAGPTEVMRQEHVTGRDYVGRIEAAARAWSPAHTAPADAFVAAVGGFTELLRDHIAKEEQVLFPMAESVLPPAVQAEVFAAFAQRETGHMGAGTHERYLAMAERLGAKYGVAAELPPRRAGGCGCSHG
ncbi:MAG: hypothetical protein HMLKMBBP_01961 [Planctomycetes bacterium]|nr:hypothetical protein [Planctomycetota bacterium]